MKEELKLFLRKVAEDKALQEKLNACASPEESYAAACSVQDGFSFDEYIDTVRQLKDAYERDQELSDEELAKAAGGVYDELTDTRYISASASFAPASAFTPACLFNAVRQR